MLRNRGTNYIDAVYGARFLGSVVGAAQERQWPRESEIVNGKVLQSNAVPGAVVNASYEAAHQKAVAAGSLSVVGSASSAVKREKVGQVEVEYQSVESDATAAGITPLISIVDGMVAPYLRGVGSGLFRHHVDRRFSLWLIRSTPDCKRQRSA